MNCACCARKLSPKMGDRVNIIVHWRAGSVPCVCTHMLSMLSACALSVIFEDPCLVRNTRRHDPIDG
jgi:hypothetical protein